jgi:hypothetical protein
MQVIFVFKPKLSKKLLFTNRQVPFTLLLDVEHKPDALAFLCFFGQLSLETRSFYSNIVDQTSQLSSQHLNRAVA